MNFQCKLSASFVLSTHLWRARVRCLGAIVKNKHEQCSGEPRKRNQFKNWMGRSLCRRACAWAFAAILFIVFSFFFVLLTMTLLLFGSGHRWTKPQNDLANALLCVCARFKTQIACEIVFVSNFNDGINRWAMSTLQTTRPSEANNNWRQTTTKN